MAMTDAQKIALFKGLLNDSSVADTVATTFLTLAESEIRLRMYPIGEAPSGWTVPGKYETLQCRLATRYYSRLGAEGEITHSENGISRTYTSVDDEDLLSEVTQIIRV